LLLPPWGKACPASAGVGRGVPDLSGKAKNNKKATFKTGTFIVKIYTVGKRAIEKDMSINAMNRLFAISDIHGCFRTFHELVVKVIDLQKTDRLILLGDYIDRGEQSREVIDFIQDLQKNGFDVTTLTGNHEQMLIDTYNDSGELPLWLMNSGLSTLSSFGLHDISELDKKYFDFFNSLEYYKAIGNFLFVHAGFNDYAEDPFADKYNMIWQCSPYYENPVLWDKIIIHGHRPKTVEHVKQVLSEKARVIPIDTGCVYEKELGYGNLSALDVNNMELISVPYRLK
jgi:serine/threonine protein phosphatase 1